MDPLNVTKSPIFEERIVKKEIHSFLPSNPSAINENDSINIRIKSDNLYLLPSESCVVIEGRITKANDAATTAKLVNNAPAFLFDNIRLELNGQLLDSVKNTGITSTIKNLISLNKFDSDMLENSGWVHPKTVVDIPTADGKFNLCMPLKTLLGFAEDFKDIIINAQLELILVRAKNSINARVGEDCKVVLTKICWDMPLITVSDSERLRLLKILKNDTPLSIPFRAWQLYEYPSLPAAKQIMWNVTTTNKLRKPRYVIIGFQTARTGIDKDNSQFDHCNITDLKVFLNDEFYPYNNLNLDIANGKYAIMYEMYSKFQSSYYNKTNQPLLRRNEFIEKAPLFVIDCSKQHDEIKTGSVNIRIDMYSSSNIPADTTAFCLIIHDCLIEYRPLTNLVQTVV